MAAKKTTKKKTPKKTVKVLKSSVTGEFVSKAQAKKSPKTTYAQTVKKA